MVDGIESDDYRERGLRESSAELFALREANLSMIFLTIFTIIASAINIHDWLNVEYQKGLDAITQKSWVIEFNQTLTGTEFTDVWQDEESRIVEFYMDDSEMVPLEGYTIGMVNVTVSPDTVDGFSVADPIAQCDAISASVIVNDMTAQWESENNILSAQDSSCEDIQLSLMVYPSYFGGNLTVLGVNEFQVLQPWRNLGWGEGVLEIKVDLDVNTAEPGPFAADDDEEITITVEVIGFLANAFPV